MSRVTFEGTGWITLIMMLYGFVALTTDVDFNEVIAFGFIGVGFFVDLVQSALMIIEAKVE